MTSLVRLAVVLIAALVVLGGRTAFAGTFQVTACKAASDSVNSSWTYVETGASAKLEHGDACTGSGEYGGLWVRDKLNDGSVGNSNGDTSGFWRFDTPPTTAVAGLTYSRYLRTYADDRFRSETRTGSGLVLEGCQLDLSSNTCILGQSGGQATTFGNLNTSRLEVGVRCASGSSTMYCINGAGIHSAQATLYGATVTISDPVNPTLGPLTGGLFAGGWVRGLRFAQLTADDATGIASFELTRDGGTSVRTSTRPCDYRLAAPCAAAGTSASSAWSDVDTASLPDGAHTFIGSAKDAAGNTTQTTSVQVSVDNTPPLAPLGIVADGGTWTPQPARSVSWSLPGGQVAPITEAQVLVCPAASSSGCFSPPATTTTSSFSLPSEGSWTATIKLVDAAGNVTTNGGTIPLGYDTTVPPAPRLGAVETADGAGYVVPVTTDDPGPAPITALQGEACPADGDGCQPVTGSGSPPDRASFQLPSPGTWTIAVRSVDAAGHVSPSAMTTYSILSPGPSPSPTATATPGARRKPSLRVTKVTLSGRRLAVRGRVSAAATGKVTVSVRARLKLRRRTVKLRSGGVFTVSVKLTKAQRGARSARLTVAYRGDKAYFARTTTRRVRRGRP